MSSSTNSFRVVPSSSSLCALPCSSTVRTHVDRENMVWCRVAGLEEIFDRIDTILSVSPVNP